MPKTVLGSQYNVIKNPVTGMLASYNSFESIRAGVTASYGSFEAIRTAMAASYAVHARIIVKLLASQNRVLQTGNRVIYARNAVTGAITKLGEIAEGATTLVDAVLADGFYDIEVRSSGNFWDETRPRVVFSIEISGGVIAAQDVPTIRLLTAEITRAFSTKLRWEIPDSAFTEGLKFGIWRSAITPVVVTGPPDFETLAYESLGKYSFILQQTADEYFAVAAILGGDQGAEAEVFQAWDVTPPASPDNQYGYNT